MGIVMVIIDTVVFAVGICLIIRADNKRRRYKTIKFINSQRLLNRRKDMLPQIDYDERRVRRSWQIGLALALISLIALYLQVLAVL